MLLMISGQINSAGEKVFEYFQVVDDLRPRHFCRRNNLWISRLLMICGQDNFAGEKDFEYFQVIHDLRPRQFCRWKNLWIFSGFGWCAAKTNLQAKKTLINFGILMIRGQDIFADEKVFESFRLLMICGQDNSAVGKDFEYFQVVDDLRLRQFCRWKTLWIFSGFGWCAAKTNLQAKKTLINFGILMIRGQDNFAGEKVFESFRLLIICGQNNFAGEKDFEYFQVVDVLRPRQFCRWKRLWIFPGWWWFAAQTFLQAKQSLNFFGYWWFAAKTNLQAKKTLNISRLLMICGQDNSAGEKISEFFQVVDDLRLRELCRRKSVGIFPSCWWFAAKTFLQVKNSLNIFGVRMICG